MTQKADGAVVSAVKTTTLLRDDNNQSGFESFWYCTSRQDEINKMPMTNRTLALNFPPLRFNRTTLTGRLLHSLRLFLPDILF